jgi:hypothetical protein
VVSCYKYGDEPSGSSATELVTLPCFNLYLYKGTWRAGPEERNALASFAYWMMKRDAAQPEHSL